VCVVEAEPGVVLDEDADAFVSVEEDLDISDDVKNMDWGRERFDICAGAGAGAGMGRPAGVLEACRRCGLAGGCEDCSIRLETEEVLEVSTSGWGDSGRGFVTNGGGFNVGAGMITDLRFSACLAMVLTLLFSLSLSCSFPPSHKSTRSCTELCRPFAFALRRFSSVLVRSGPFPRSLTSRP